MRLLTPVLFLLFTLQIDAQFIRDYEREKREQFLGEAWYANPSLRVNVSALANTLNGGLGFVFEYPFHQKWSAEVPLSIFSSDKKTIISTRNLPISTTKRMVEFMNYCYILQMGFKNGA